MNVSPLRIRRLCNIKMMDLVYFSHFAHDERGSSFVMDPILRINPIWITRDAEISSADLGHSHED